jgi:hypothetical protein
MTMAMIGTAANKTAQNLMSLLAMATPSPDVGIKYSEHSDERNDMTTIPVRRAWSQKPQKLAALHLVEASTRRCHGSKSDASGRRWIRRPSGSADRQRH